MFLRFLPAMSGKAAKAIRQTVRRWHLRWGTPTSLGEIDTVMEPQKDLVKIAVRLKPLGSIKG